jgi:glycine/D-amino acid oxidase-like deaminating enzyme
VLVVGGGLVGLAVAWELLNRGLAVELIDPDLDQASARACDRSNGSLAALGVLMSQVFHRSSGRGWRLRQQSHQLWQQWLIRLQERGHRLNRRDGLLLLAATPEELEHQQRLVAQRQRQGISLHSRDLPWLRGLRPSLPAAALGGLQSPGDGQLDPRAVLAALWCEARAAGLSTCRDTVTALERRGSDWQVHCQSGSSRQASWLVLSAGVASAGLLAGLGHQLPMEPVLGQALELELAETSAWDQGDHPWPGAVVWRGINLVPRPDLPGGGHFWLGATLEPGDQPGATALAHLRSWGAAELPWLERAQVVRQWQGLRCRPVGRPAPLLEQLEPGLLLVSGHYRNGVLLAPASAAWACDQIQAGR